MHDECNLAGSGASQPASASTEADREYDLKVREIALRLTVERARDSRDIDINKCFRWFERLLRYGQ